MVDRSSSTVMTLEEATQHAKDMDLLRRTIRRALRQTAIERWLEAKEREAAR